MSFANDEPRTFGQELAVQDGLDLSSNDLSRFLEDSIAAPCGIHALKSGRDSNTYVYSKQLFDIRGITCYVHVQT